MMKISYYSTFLNHHQIEFCDRMFQIHGTGFTFISTNRPPKDRIDQGFSVYERPYAIFEDEQMELAERLFIESDVVILAVHRDKWLKHRLQHGKITFLHQERLFKEKPSVYRWLRALGYVWVHYIPYSNSPLFMLSASAYAQKDYYGLGCFKNKCFEWGYFPPIENHDVTEIEKMKQQNTLSIVWSGRLLKWKHPEYAVEVARTLKDHGIMYNMKLIGDGEEFSNVQTLIDRYSLNDRVTMIGFIPQQEVRKHMSEANIFLFTSNREEGYGAVVVEAMNAACTVIGSETAGSIPFLIRNGYNGYVYRRDSVAELCEVTLKVANDRSLLKKTGINAYRTIISEQNGIVAAKRFSDICSKLRDKRTIEGYSSGPMMILR